MSKWRKEENSQARQNNTLAIKQSQGSLVLPQELQIIFWAMSSQLFGRYWNPYQVEKVNCVLHLDSRPVRTRRLMMLTPSYLTTNQSEERPRADHVLLLAHRKTPQYSLQRPDTPPWGMSLLRCPLPQQSNKAVSASPKPLFLRFNPAPLYNKLNFSNNVANDAVT